MGGRIRLWWRILRAGFKPLDSATRFIAVVVLLLGIGGITVTFVLHLPWPVIVVILLAVLLVVVLEGAWQVWAPTDRERLSAEAAREALRQAGEERAGNSPQPLEVRYQQRLPYRLPNRNMVRHRIGIFNPRGNPEAAGVRVVWTAMSPRPGKDLGYPPVVPQGVPMVAGGDPTIGISLPPGQEELWLIGTTATDANGVSAVGVFGPGRPGWYGTPWYFEAHDRWRLTYRVVADDVPGTAFSVVMTAAGGGIRCDIEG